MAHQRNPDKGYIIIFDTEATCWSGEDGLSSWWKEDWQEPEIIQISAITLDTNTYKEIAAPLDILIKPRINPILSNYCTDLTGITNQILDESAVSFQKAAEQFHLYCNGQVPHSYGNDADYMNYNRDELYGLKQHITPFIGHDISALFHLLDPATKIKKINSGALSQHFGLSFVARQHYALDDCRSIAASLEHFKSHPELLSYMKVKRAP